MREMRSLFVSTLVIFLRTGKLESRLVLVKLRKSKVSRASKITKKITKYWQWMNRFSLIHNFRCFLLKTSKFQLKVKVEKQVQVPPISETKSFKEAACQQYFLNASLVKTRTNLTGS